MASLTLDEQFDLLHHKEFTLIEKLKDKGILSKVCVLTLKKLLKISIRLERYEASAIIQKELNTRQPQSTEQ